MKKAVIFQIFLLIFAVSVILEAQNNVSLPSVSKITAELKNNLVRLTWEDSPSAKGNVYIYRSTRTFGDSPPVNIRPIIVNYGVQSYIDDTEDIDNIYYFIAASEVSGIRYDTIVTQYNSIYINLSEGIIEIPSQPPITRVQGISNLNARYDGERVTITFSNSEPDKNAVLYRSARQIGQPYDLLNSVIVQSGRVSSFTDFPVRGISWFYAVIYEDEIASGNFKLQPGLNTTVTPIILLSSEVVEHTLRPIPLPLLTFNTIIDDIFFLDDNPAKASLRPEVSRFLRSVRTQDKPALVLKTPRVFRIDIQEYDMDDEALSYIIANYFKNFNWKDSQDELIQYLTLPRSKDAEIRARFYLGQTLYFTGSYKDALFEFLYFKSSYPDEAGRWIDAILSAMVY